MSKEQIEEVFKDLCEAPTGCVKEDFRVGTLKESHTDLFIRTVAGHLVSLNYSRQIEAEWVKVYQNKVATVYECSRCNHLTVSTSDYCICGAHMKGV